MNRYVRKLDVTRYELLPAGGVENALFCVQEHVVEESAGLRPKDGRNDGTPEPVLAERDSIR